MIQEKVEYKVYGRVGTWCVIDRAHGYVLLESCQYGDDAAYLVAREDQETPVKAYRRFTDRSIVKYPTIYRDFFETYDDIETCLKDEGLL